MSNETRRNRAEPTIEERAALQWANGRTEYKGEKGRMAPLVGWHVEVGRSAELDALAASHGLARITIRHQRQGEAPALVEHWYLGEAVRVYPLTYGPLTDTVRGAVRLGERMADEAGIVASWTDRSYLGLLALVEVGGEVCAEPLVLSAKSTMTDHLYGAILAHLAMCEAADGVAGTTVPCCYLALPLAAGEEYPAGRTETTTITPMRTAYDRAPAAVDVGYLKSISLAKHLREWAAGLCELSPAWARETLEKQRGDDPRTAAQRREVAV